MAAAEPRAGGFRADVQGLRALAVGLVLLYHAGLPPRAGFLGVDVFFVISGYLITGLLARELAATGTISWGRFVARRIRRLLPAAVLVLAVTAVAAWFVIPGLRRLVVGHDIEAAAFYVINWVLAARAVDYLAADASASPVQHYWSLSVEEQFYVVWPLLLIAAVLVLRRLRPGWLDRGPGGGPRLRVLAAVLAAVAVPSLAWSLWLTHTDPARAYFVTTTRAWELGAGAALALWTAGRAAVPDGAAPTRPGDAAAGWVGLLLVGAAAVLLPADVAWPGGWALVPVAGTVMILYAGWAAPGRGVARLLGWRPLVAVGGLSYSLYLWHWPARVLGEWALSDVGVTAAPTLTRTALIAASVGPAWLGRRYLEEPLHHGTGALGAWLGALPSLRRPRPVWRTLALAPALSSVGLVAAVGLGSATSPIPDVPPSGVLPPGRHVGSRQPRAGPTEHAGAEPRAGDVGDPGPPGAERDRPAADVNHCQVDRLATVPVACTFGDRRSSTVIALVGDSKALQWLPALRQVAAARGWRIVTYGKSSCTFSAAPARLGGAAYPSCDTWTAGVMADLARLRPAVVVTSANTTPVTGARLAAEIAGFETTWRQLQRLGSKVVVIGNNPLSPNDLDVCAARHPMDLGQCDFPRGPAVAGAALGTTRTAAAEMRLPFIDLTPWLCPTPRCPVVIDHVTVNRAGDHITATYAATLASRIDPVVAHALEGS